MTDRTSGCDADNSNAIQVVSCSADLSAFHTGRACSREKKGVSAPFNARENGIHPPAESSHLMHFVIRIYSDGRLPQGRQRRRETISSIL
ncbi:MAG: hypothetical protein JNJ56_14300 [Ignavibacteria bacterium]|nr:hypothetical protein [Ignavibacteria bacterium]